MIAKDNIWIPKEEWGMWSTVKLPVMGKPLTDINTAKIVAAAWEPGTKPGIDGRIIMLKFNNDSFQPGDRITYDYKRGSQFHIIRGRSGDWLEARVIAFDIKTTFFPADKLQVDTQFYKISNSI